MGDISPGGSFKAIGREFGGATCFNFVVNTMATQHSHDDSYDHCASEGHHARVITLIDLGNKPDDFREKFHEKYGFEHEPLSRTVMLQPQDFIALCDKVSSLLKNARSIHASHYLPSRR